MMNGLLHFFELFRGPFLNVAVLSFLGLIWCGCLFGDEFSYDCSYCFLMEFVSFNLFCLDLGWGWHRFGSTFASFRAEVGIDLG